MSKNIAVKGMSDILPLDSGKWQYIERSLLETAENFGFSEIRTPVLEHTELFIRSVGETTDVVQKEMYTFEKEHRSLTLRPEGTAGVVRSLLQNGLYNEALPFKCSYIVSCYRYEKPQAGRLREFHQFGAECFGSEQPSADAEMISLAEKSLRRLGVTDLTLEINSIGCPSCRGDYNAALKAYFGKYTNDLCGTCLERLDRNPMRILDCKCPSCQEIAKNAPRMLQSLCAECAEHFEDVKECLTAIGIEYKINPSIVRGLDYYTRTVFEFISGKIGAQSTVCGGGRYDGLVETMGGPALPALGFAMGLERLLMVMDAVGAPFPEEKRCDIYIAPAGAAAAQKSQRLTSLLRDEGYLSITDLSNRSLKAQMKYANKLGAKYTVVIGEDELSKGNANLKNMEDGSEIFIPLDEAQFIKSFYNVVMSATYEDIAESFKI